ncbi:ABC transporter permease [Brucella intermedia]|uniref:ABC transporter permease n=1 Tax=Brucella intermedia TaxID=94625 RepID=UPI00224A762A|nr:ABC transporter permease [Brucella intermedia]
MNKPSQSLSSRGSWKTWLHEPVPRSNLQAATQQAYNGICQLGSNPSGLVGLVIVSALILIAIFAPYLATHDILVQDLTTRLLRPSAEHLLGTDELGRDIYSRTLYGARITLYITFTTAAIAGPLGLIVGTTAGYLGGWVDAVLMRIVDVFLAFPSLILALAFVAAMGPGLQNAVIAISLAAWPPIARLARAETLMIRKSDFVAAIRLQGASSARIIFVHIIPMCLPSMIIRVTLNMAGIILTAASLGFLGLGAQPPSPEWGAMLSSGREFIISNGWIAGVPGGAILISSLGFNLLGDALRDVMDPKHG